MKKIKCLQCGMKVKAKTRTRKYCPFCARQRNLKQGSNSSTKRMIRNREFVKECKKSKMCKLCGYNKFPEILVFHHENRKEKTKGVSILMKTLKNLEIIKKEMDKCILLCPNCHRELHFKEKSKK